ncbi:MAG: hypothetical protein O2913_06910 [Chloroflexi bacterium]|nr:hypothetical protein [Chloroflexota bacterium]
MSESINQEGITAGDDRKDQAERLQQLQEEPRLSQVIYEANFGCNVHLEHQIKAAELIPQSSLMRG